MISFVCFYIHIHEHCSMFLGVLTRQRVFHKCFDAVINFSLCQVQIIGIETAEG